MRLGRAGVVLVVVALGAALVAGVSLRGDGSAPPPRGELVAAQRAGGSPYFDEKIPPSPVLSPDETRRLGSLSGTILNLDDYSEPIFYATRVDQLRKVTCVKYACVGGSRAPLNGDEVVSSGSDGQLVVVDTERKRTYEMYQVRTDPDGTVRIDENGAVEVAAMSVLDLDGRVNRAVGGASVTTTGAGLSRYFGVVRARDISNAASSPRTAIPHALQVSLPSQMNCSTEWREPATKTDGRSTSASCIPQGARIQLNPDVDCDGLPTKLGQAICFAMQKYGAYVTDSNGSSAMAFYGQYIRSWSTGVVDYAAVGFTDDYQSVDLPTDELRVLSSWNGR